MRGVRRRADSGRAPEGGVTAPLSARWSGGRTG